MDRAKRIKEIKQFADALQSHIKEIEDDKYGCPDVLIGRAWGALQVLVQDYVI